MEIMLKRVALPARFRLSEPMNDEELLQFCANNGDLRIEQEPGGEILVMSPVGTESAAIEGEVYFQLRLWAGPDGRGRAFSAGAGFRLRTGAVKSPDAAWVSFACWNAQPSKRKRSYPRVCPEFVVEVRSESDRLPSMRTKMKMWIANGAQVGWLIDPRRKEVTIYRRGQLPEILREPSSIHGTGPIAGFELIPD